jgi:hypothetical protein
MFSFFPLPLLTKGGKILKNLVKQRCAEGFNSGVKWLTFIFQSSWTWHNLYSPNDIVKQTTVLFKSFHTLLSRHGQQWTRVQTSATKPINSSDTSLCWNLPTHRNLLCCPATRKAWPKHHHAVITRVVTWLHYYINEAAYRTFLQTSQEYQIPKRTARSSKDLQSYKRKTKKYFYIREYSISVYWNQRGALFIQFIENQRPLHVSSITCSSSGGTTQTAFGILRAYGCGPCHSHLHYTHVIYQMLCV